MTSRLVGIGFALAATLVVMGMGLGLTSLRSGDWQDRAAQWLIVLGMMLWGFMALAYIWTVALS